MGKIQTYSTAGTKLGSVSLPVEMLFDDAGYIHNHQEEQGEESEIGTREDNNNYSADLI